MKKFYLWLLVAEFLVAGSAGVIFRSVPSKLLAGMIAGTIFVAIGIFIVMIGFQNRAFRRTPTFVMGCVHLFVIALPMLMTRLINFSKGFDEILVLGLPGPTFHSLATGVFGVLMLATAFDLLRVWRARTSVR